MDPETINPNSVIAAFAGSISGLAFMPWESMGWKKIALTVFVGFTCATFVAPWLTYKLFGQTDARTVAMMTYGVAAGAHALLPKFLKILGRMIGEKV